MNSNDRKMKRNLAYFSSNEDICRALGCDDSKIIKYSQLANYHSLHELLPEPFDYKIILLENDYNSGHWVCIIRMKKIIELFNSYGIPIDSEFRFIPDWIERWLGQDKRYLTNLIKKSTEFDVISNKIRFQSKRPEIATCGRWISHRIEMAKMGYSLQEYINLMQSIQEKYDIPYDELIVGFIRFVGDNRK
jgi:hypothetical protein